MRKLRSEQKIMANWKGDSQKPVVSICCMAYNHEPYIEDALEGFLIQETDFPFEILIHDDASTDKTADIIREYEATYPNLIKPIYQTENQFSQGIKPNHDFNFPRAKGEYIALCEGDDYWTEKKKLQKQIKFLNENNDYTVCAHLVKCFYQDQSKPSNINPYPKMQKDTYYLKDFLYKNYMNTCSVVYRWIFYSYPKPSWIAQHFTGDYTLHSLHACHGKIKMLPEVMACYRKHSGGIMSGSRGKHRVSMLEDRIAFMRNINEYSNYVYNDTINKIIINYKFSLANALLCEGRIDESKYMFKESKRNMKLTKKVKYLYRLWFPKLFEHTRLIYHKFNNFSLLSR